MKISATIICKNEADHILDCIGSLAGVDEIVVCDTGSEDGTVALVEGLEDDRIKLVHIEWSDHFAKARNAALAHATGDWCIVIDADEKLEEGTVDALHRAIWKANSGDGLELTTLRFLCYAECNRAHAHQMVRAHKRTPEIFWRGRIHEALSADSMVLAEGCSLVYGHSTAHARDPDRAMRLLQMDYDEAVDAGRKPTPRTLYYLAREHIYRNEYALAISILKDRVKEIGFRSECADAWLYLAKCYWNLNMGDKAREACLQSLLMVPDCKESLEFMAEISWKNEGDVWRVFASVAKNKNVLFVRS